MTTIQTPHNKAVGWEESEKPVYISDKMRRPRMRDKIEEILIGYFGSMFVYSEDKKRGIERASNDILALLAPELEKARRYDMNIIPYKDVIKARKLDEIDSIVAKFRRVAPRQKNIVDLILAFGKIEDVLDGKETP